MSARLLDRAGVEAACPLCRAPMPGHSIGIEVLSLTFLDCMMEFVMPACSVPTFPPSTQLTSWTEVKLGNVIVALVEEAAIVRTRADKQYMNWMFDSPRYFDAGSRRRAFIPHTT